jgi:hypothetical protein
VTYQAERTYGCRECLDVVWVTGPAPITVQARRSGVTEYEWDQRGYKAARPCLGCDAGLRIHAGLWRRYIHEDAKKPDPVRALEFVAAMDRLGQAGQRIKELYQRGES